MTIPLKVGGMDPLEAVRIATAHRSETVRAADGQWREAIRLALAAGVLPREVAAAAGVTRPRVVQIAQSAEAGV